MNVKTALGVEGDNLNVFMPMQKIDKENRRVSGWATLDNLDLQGDIVLKEASERAFGRSRMNVREMHQPKAVGKILNWRADTYVHEDGNTYSGIYVDVYVSKGAEDTWQKVLDGTLQAFSIKGPILDSENAVSKSDGKTHRIIKDYDLEELSLVDSGGNQLANVVSFQKVNGDTLVSGMVTEVVVENVYFCEKDEVAKYTVDDTAECALCGEGMENIGWYERSEGVNSTQKVLEVIAKFRGSSELASTEDITKEVNGTMADEQKKEETVEVTETTTVVEETPVKEEETVTEEKAVQVDETENAGDDLVKLVTDLKETVERSLTETEEASKARFTDLETKVAEIQKSINDRLAESEKKGEDLAQKFNSLADEVNSFTKRLNTVEDTTAVKKSGDLGGSQEETVEKSNTSGSVWRGTFLGVDDL